MQRYYWYWNHLRRSTRNHRYLSSATNDDCPFRGFAKRYPIVASQLLKVPPFSYEQTIANNPSSHPFEPGRDESLEQFIKWRGWKIDDILGAHSLDDKLSIDASIGLLSHPLTFPLTLGRHLRTLFNNKQNVRLCCVGARAECTLPVEYWRELLIAALVTDIDGNLRQYSIDFIGPDVPTQLKLKTITLDNEGEASKTPARSVLTMNFHSSFLHEVVLKIRKSQQIGIDQIRNLWDAFILFNPGIGHSNLTEHWKPTLKFLIGTGKPVLFTAHSAMDAERDRLVLEQLLDDSNDRKKKTAQYQVNPYASRMQFVDPFTKYHHVHVVSPNHSFFLLK